MNSIKVYNKVSFTAFWQCYFFWLKHLFSEQKLYRFGIVYRANFAGYLTFFYPKTIIARQPTV